MYSKQGYFQALFSCIERMLISLKIEHFMLPAAHEAEAIWMKKFGFSKIPQEQVCYNLHFAELFVMLSVIVVAWWVQMPEECKSNLMNWLQLEAYLNGAHLTIFYGTSNLYKAVPLSQH